MVGFKGLLIICPLADHNEAIDVPQFMPDVHVCLSFNGRTGKLLSCRTPMGSE